MLNFSPASETVESRLFGTRLTLQVPADQFLIDDTTWRTKAIYEPFLAARSLPKIGTALDIGAGYGGFAIPFAVAFPDWTVWCLEPEPAAFRALRANIDALGLTNVMAVNAAVADVDLPDARVADIGACLAAGKITDATRLCPAGKFRQSKKKRGYLESATGTRHPAFRPVSFPTVPARALGTLNPTLLKIVAPGCSKGILTALGESTLEFIVGEQWQPIRSDRLLRKDGTARDVYLPLAGTTMKLRQSRDTSRHHGLDVVVAMYNTRTYIKECVDSIISTDIPAIRALVVDDGSTDGCGDLVASLYAGNPRVVLLRKPNGGCASARNYGRQHSDRTHITFVDADDRTDPDLFPKLMEMAQYSGAEVVQGSYANLYTDEAGERLDIAPEEAGFAKVPRFGLGDLPVFTVGAAALMTGQPTIWRRVYRRDFLDNKKIWFPEHIRAFDDQIFQMLTLYYAGTVLCTDQVRYHYRQHAGQDIRAGDERMFYSLEMFRMMLKRGLAEGWGDFHPVLRSYVNTVNWIGGGLRADLKPVFAKAAAELWVYMQKSLGPQLFATLPVTEFHDFDFAHHVEHFTTKLARLPNSFMWSYLDSAMMHVDAVREDAKARG
ncbi:MAG: FkbM family methyltransferase [Pseudomonadota bacterium]